VTWVRGPEQGGRDPNLLPHRQAALRRQQRYGMALWIGVWALWLVAGVGAWLWLDMALSAQLASNQAVQSRWQALQPEPPVLASAPDGVAPQRPGVAALDLLQALQQLAQAKPDGVVLQHVRLAPGWLELDGQTGSPARVRDWVGAVQWPAGFAKPLTLVHVLRPARQEPWTFRLRALRPAPMRKP
jgi:hypothetical protein